MAEKRWSAYPKPPRQPPKPPETISGIARRYHACALALATTWGLPVEQVLREHRESVTAVFIETSRAELRLAAGVQLPPLATPPGQAKPPDRRGPDSPQAAELPQETQASPGPEGFSANAAKNSERGGAPSTPDAQAKGAEADGEPPPVAIPAGLPCSGVLLVDLKPAQLVMLIGKVEALAQAKGGAWRSEACRPRRTNC